MFPVLGFLCSLISFVFSIIILIHAFKNAIWKGVLCLVTCGLYFLYYSLVEFQHEKKWLIVIGAYLPSILSVIFSMMSR